MAWLGSLMGTAGTTGAASTAATSGVGSGLMSKAGSYLASDAGKNTIMQAADSGKQGSQQASAQAAAQGAAPQGMQFANSGGYVPPQQSMPQGMPQRSGYDPLSIYERMNQFRRG